MPRITIAIVIALHAAIAFAVEPPEERFQSMKWPGDPSQGQPDYLYRLYIPEGSSYGLRPLLVWFHGHKERGEDNIKNLRWMELLFGAVNDSPPMYILVPQHHSNEDWSSEEDSNTDALAVTLQIIDQVSAKFPIDPDRVYLAGVSSGGNACLTLAFRHPDRFAAIAPMGSGGGSLSWASTFRRIPIWLFHSYDDTATNPDGDRALIAALQKAGGIAALTETEWKPNRSSNHDCWTAAFQDYNVLDWLLAQRRGEAVQWYPGPTVRQSTWIWFRHNGWLIVAWSGIVLVLRYSWKKMKTSIISADTKSFDGSTKEI